MSHKGAVKGLIEAGRAFLCLRDRIDLFVLMRNSNDMCACASHVLQTAHNHLLSGFVLGEEVLIPTEVQGPLGPEVVVYRSPESKISPRSISQRTKGVNNDSIVRI